MLPQILHEYSPLFFARCLIIIKYVESSQIIFHIWHTLCTYVCICMWGGMHAWVWLCEHTRVCTCVCVICSSVFVERTPILIDLLWWLCGRAVDRVHLSLKMLFCLSGLLCVFVGFFLCLFILIICSFIVSYENR